MKKLLFLTLSLILLSCNRQENTLQLQAQIDSLESQLKSTYKPGLGDLMLNMQIRHAKLWFAGENANWKLAEFQVHELHELIENIENFHHGDEEIQMIGIMHPALDSVSHAVDAKDLNRFESSFSFLTDRCNNCHLASGHEYNVITIPTAMPVVNQRFAPIK